MKALTKIKAARAFACLLVVSVLTTTVASPLHLVFAAPTSQKSVKTKFLFDKKYQYSVLMLMRNFIFDGLVRPKLTAAGCTFKTVAEYATNPECFPESTTDATKKLTLSTIQKNLLHEVFAGTTGKCGAHRDGRKGAYTIEQCIGYPWGVENCAVMDGNISALGIPIPQHCAKKSVPISTSNKVPYSAPNKATRDQVKVYLTKVLNSPNTYKGACKATTLAQLTTLPDCNTSALMNPDNYKVMKEVWRTLYTAAYDASGADYGISRQNTVGRKGTLYELGVIPNYNGDAHKLVDGTKSFGVTLPKTTAAQNSKLTVGLTNTVLICLAGGFAILACFTKLPDEYARGFLQLFINKDVLPQNWKTLYGNLSIDKLGVDIGEVGVDLLTNTLLVYGLQKGTNQVIKLINAMTMKKSPEALADLLIDAKTTMKIMIVGPLIVVALTACKALGKCDQPFQFQNSELIDDTTKGGIIAFFVAVVFCLKNKKIDPTCVKNTISVILFEFTHGHFLFKRDGVTLAPGPNHTVTRLGIGTISAYGGVKFLEGVFKTLSELSGKMKFLNINKLAEAFKGLSEKIKRKWGWSLAGLFAAFQLNSLQNDLRSYDTFTQNPNCINSPSCAFAALKTADTISNHPIPKAWDAVAGFVNNIRISNIAVVSGNTLTIPSEKNLNLVGTLFSKIERDKNNICKAYRPRTSLDASFKAYLPTSCKNASII